MTVLPKPTHMNIVGATQKGKTTYANKLHRTFGAGLSTPTFSIFVDTKGTDRDKLWGLRTRTLSNLPQLLAIDTRIVWDPPRAPDGIIWEKADAELLALWNKIQRVSLQSRWRTEDALFFQLCLDEAGKWQDETDSSRPRTVEDMAERMLGMGGRLACIQQHPGTLGTHTRNNLDTRIIYGLGDEGRRCIKNWNWPEAHITPWTARPYHYATSHPVLGWRLHCPTPRASPCATCGRAAGAGPETLPT